MHHSSRTSSPENGKHELPPVKRRAYRALRGAVLVTWILGACSLTAPADKDEVDATAGTAGIGAAGGSGANAKGGSPAKEQGGNDTGTPGGMAGSAGMAGGSAGMAGGMGGGPVTSECTSSERRCVSGADEVETCVDGKWKASEECSGTTPLCMDGACAA